MFVKKLIFWFCRMDKHPVERSRLYFLLAWFHAVIQERLRYIPMGWTKVFSLFPSSVILTVYLPIVHIISIDPYREEFIT